MGDLGLMPPGTLPPLVLEYNASSSIPVILVTVSGPYSETELQNEGRYNVRNFMATVEGASVPYPSAAKFARSWPMLTVRSFRPRASHWMMP